MSKALGRFATVGNLLTATGVFTEVLRAYPWLLFIGVLSLPGWTYPPMALLGAFVIMAVTAYLVRGTVGGGLHMAETRIGTLIIGIVLILLFTRLGNSGGYALWDPAWFQYAKGHIYAIIGALLFGIFLLWRGITVGREEMKTSYLYRNFMIGIASFIVLIVIWAASGITAGDRLFLTLMPYVLGYFFTALMGLGVGNFLSLREGIGTRGKATDLFARRWLIVLVSTVVIITAVATIVASGLSLNLARLILDRLNTAAGWLATGFLYGLGYALGFIVAGISLVVSLFYSLIHISKMKPPPNVTSNGGDLTKQLQSGHTSPQVLAVLQWVLLAAVVAVVVYFLWRALYRYWKGSQEKGYEEINESLWGNFGADMRSFLRGLADRFRRKPGARAVPPLAATMTDADQFVSVRELYRGLLWVGAESGRPKATAETPFEYRNTLKRAIEREPALREGLADLTDAYVEERYGHVMVDRERGMALVRLWLRLRSALRGTQEGNEAR